MCLAFLSLGPFAKEMWTAFFLPAECSMKIGHRCGNQRATFRHFLYFLLFRTLVIYTLLFGISPFCSLSLPVIAFLFCVGYFLLPYLQIFLFCSVGSSLLLILSCTFFNHIHNVMNIFLYIFPVSTKHIQCLL